MRKQILAALASAFFAVQVPAATTWSSIAPTITPWTSSGRSVQAVCTTGTEAAPSGIGTDAAPVGLLLSSVRSYTVVVEAVTDAATVTGGTLKAYFYDESGTDWVRIPDLDLTIPAVAAHGYTFLGSSPGIGQPVIAGGWGRLAWLPDSVTISAGNLAVRIQATGTRGEKL